MLTPEDVQIEKHTFENGDVEYHVMIRVFEKKTISLLKGKREFVPTETFKLYTDTDAEGFTWQSGKHTELISAQNMQKELLNDYYHSLAHKIEKV